MTELSIDTFIKILKNNFAIGEDTPETSLAFTMFLLNKI